MTVEERRPLIRGATRFPAISPLTEEQKAEREAKWKAEQAKKEEEERKQAEERVVRAHAFVCELSDRLSVGRVVGGSQEQESATLGEYTDETVEERTERMREAVPRIDAVPVSKGESRPSELSGLSDAERMYRAVHFGDCGDLRALLRAGADPNKPVLVGPNWYPDGPVPPLLQLAKSWWVAEGKRDRGVSQNGKFGDRKEFRQKTEADCQACLALLLAAGAKITHEVWSVALQPFNFLCAHRLEYKEKLIAALEARMKELDLSPYTLESTGFPGRFNARKWIIKCPVVPFKKPPTLEKLRKLAHLDESN